MIKSLLKVNTFVYIVVEFFLFIIIIIIYINTNEGAQREHTSLTHILMGFFQGLSLGFS